MGKPTGFLEYERCENRRRPPLERVRDWEDLYIPTEGEHILWQDFNFEISKMDGARIDKVIVKRNNTHSTDEQP